MIYIKETKENSRNMHYELLREIPIRIIQDMFESEPDIDFHKDYLKACEEAKREASVRRTLQDPKKIKSLLFGLKEVGNTNLWIEDVIFNKPATIVKWDDGTKTVVKCGEHDTFDKEKGLAMAIIKKLCGNSGNFNNLFKEFGCYGEIEVEETKEEPKPETKAKNKKSKVEAKPLEK